jgi:hypothetical protein
LVGPYTPPYVTKQNVAYLLLGRPATPTGGLVNVNVEQPGVSSTVIGTIGPGSMIVVDLVNLTQVHVMSDSNCILNVEMVFRG